MVPAVRTYADRHLVILRIMDRGIINLEWVSTLFGEPSCFVAHVGYMLKLFKYGANVFGDQRGRMYVVYWLVGVSGQRTSYMRFNDSPTLLLCNRDT